MKYMRVHKAAEHIRRLRATGTSMDYIAAHVPCSPSLLHSIIRGEKHHTEARIVVGILKVEADPDAWDPVAGGVAVTRMLQALGVRGYALGHITGDNIPVCANLGRLREGVLGYCRRSTYDAVTAFYQQHKDTPGPSKFSATRCANRGWIGPDGWSDIIAGTRV